MTGHLGYEKNSSAGDNSGNSRNWHTEKTVLLENQNTTIEGPRDRNGTFEPVIVPKHEKRVPYIQRSDYINVLVRDERPGYPETS
jgi:transposase-like protein